MESSSIISVHLRSNHASQASQPIQSPLVSGYTRSHKEHTAVSSSSPGSLSMVRCCKSLSSAVESPLLDVCFCSISVFFPSLFCSYIPHPSFSLCAETLQVSFLHHISSLNLFSLSFLICFIFSSFNLQ